MSLLSRIALDTTALRQSRRYRVLALSTIVGGLGQQAALVAVPYQVYVLTHSAALVGLISAVELGPTIVVGLYGGAIADRMDRSRLLAIAQVALALSAGLLTALAFLGHPPVVAIFVLAALLAASTALDWLSRAAMVPALTGEHLRSAIAFSWGMAQVTAIAGPGLAGIVIGAGGVGYAYLIDAASVVATLAAVAVIGPQHPPEQPAEHPPIGRAIADGLRFIASSNALLGSYVIDIFAMTFGMPRVLFVVLSLDVYHAGAAGTGLLYAAVSAGAAVAALTTGWLAHARWIGRITIAMVLVWGATIALAGLTTSLALAAVLFALAGAADSISAVCRTTISQLITTEQMRGRTSAVYGIVVTGGVRLGDIESGEVAALSSARFAVLSGGLACIVSIGAVLLLFPKLASFDAHAEHPGSSPAAG
ncbi:MAG TPA: MFS transporter [Solirubrobacteraceae bacterium]|nr:MFS transporter [Solirubrobacteraceae bacterium]